jgi:predicted nucleotidyltransferase
MNISFILDEVIKKIISNYREEVEQIILYGSYAKGTQKKNSDIDILVLFDQEMSKISDIVFANDLYRCFLEKYNKEVHIVFEKYSFYLNKCEEYYKEVPEYGKILYRKKEVK